MIPDPAALQEAWRVEVGEGQASPVVGPPKSAPGPLRENPWIYSHSRSGDRETIQALDLATGASVWRQQFDEPYEPYPGAQSFGKGPKSTPALDDGRLCTLAVTGTVTCVDAATGDVLWRKSYGERFPEPYPPFGTSMSPLFDGGRLVVHVGGHPAGALLALDPATGDELWSYRGEGPGYSSPIVATVDGTRQIVTQAHRNIIAVEAETGRLLWSYPSVTPCDQNIVTPTWYRDLLIFSSVDAGVFALRARRTADGWRVERAWHNQERSMYMSSPVVVGDALVGFAQRRRGELFALDAATGQERWASDSRQGEHAALVGSGDRVLVFKSGGDLVLFEAEGSGFRRHSAREVAQGEVWTHPVPVPGGWLIKDESSLRLFRYHEPRTIEDVDLRGR